MTRKLTGFGTLLVLLATFAGGPVCATNPVPAYIDSALADPARPAEQVAHDADRKAAGVLAFSGVKPGDKVADFMSSGAYFTRLFSRIVGDTGRVYAIVPQEQMKNCAPEETAGTLALQRDGHYANVSVVIAPVNEFHVPEVLDLVWTSLNFHDLYDSFMGPADVPKVTSSIFAALKPGGVFLVVDHVAEAGSEIRDTATRHRIDPEVIVRRAQAAGFRLEGKSDLLRNPQDTHELRVFDPAIRGHTDQVILKFRKPTSAAQESEVRPAP
jgi:predicted methyltransferase